MRRLHGIPGALSLSICLLFAAPALAQGEVDDADYQEMLELSEKAAAAFGEGEFEKAAKLFEAADAIKPDAVLKMNAMIAWFKHGDCTSALDASEKFLAASPEVSEDPQILSDQRSARSVQFKCNVSLGAQALDGGERSDALAFAQAANAVYTSHTSEFDADDKASLDALNARLEAGKKETPPDGPIEDPVEPAPAEGPLSVVGWAGVGGLAVGGVLLGVGGALYASNIEQFTNCSEEAPAGAVCELNADEIAQAQSTVQTQQILMIAGGSLAAVGAGLLVYDLVSGDSGDAETARVTPTIGPDGGGVQVRFSF